MAEFIQKRNISSTAKNILKKRYFSNEEKEWKDIANRVVDFVAKDFDEKYEPGSKEELRKMILHTYFVPNSPALVNAGNNNMGLCACFVVDFKDTIEDIYKTKLDFALVARKGGGCGTSLEKIRPEGSKVNGSTHGYAGGGIKFADTISHDADALTQAGFRSMAIMFTQSVYHPDIIKFITAKTEEGRIANANISVIVDNNFMNKVKNNENYWTEFNGVKYNQYKARDIFDLIVEGAWKNGEPGLLFRDRIDNSPYQYTGQKIFSTNPCIYKETYMLDGDILHKISNENNKTFKSWKTRIKKCIKLTTNAGHEIIVTPDHKIMLENKTFIEAKDSLNKILKWGLGNRKIKDKNKDAVLLGFLFGDGFLCGSNFGVSVKINPEKELEVSNLLTEYGFHQQESGAFYINKNELENKLNRSLDFLTDKVYNREIPEYIIEETSDYLGSFLSGLFEANGSVTKFNSQISIKTTCSQSSKMIQVLLASFGIQSWIVTNKPNEIEWKNGNYTSKESYNVQIAPRNSMDFYNRIGFFSNVKNNRIKSFDKPYNGKLKVIKIEDVGDLEVWDFSNEIHYNFANGIVAHNCSEQPLPPNGVCNIGSLDLSKFYDINKKGFDYKLFEVACRLGVRFLDSVIDKTSFPTKDIEQWSKENRAIALGIMGWADLLLMMKIPYGTPEANLILEEILDFMSVVAYDESERIGKEFGIPLQCKKLPIPRRNITVTTIAPTGTVSLIAGCSSGLEPIFSEITIRNDRTGTYTFENELASKPYFRCAVSSNGATEVTWEEHVNTLASAQKYIDSGVSKTINFPNKTHKETIGKAMFKAWELGCKGIAVYRNGSRKVEVLSPKNLKKEKCPICGNDLVTINEKQKCLTCKTETLIENILGAYDN